MAVIMISELAGADTGVVEGLRQAGVLDALQKASGFGRHLSGATDSGYQVIEVWDSREAHQAWFAEWIAPNLPPGAPTPETQYIDLVLDLPQA